MKKLILFGVLGLFSLEAVAELNKLEKGITNACKESGARSVDLCVLNTQLFIALAYKNGYTKGVCFDAQYEEIKKLCTPDIYTGDDMNNFKNMATKMLGFNEPTM